MCQGNLDRILNIGMGSRLISCLTADQPSLAGELVRILSVKDANQRIVELREIITEL